MLSIFPRDVLDEILDLIESVSEGFPTYSYKVWSGYKVDTISLQKKGGNSSKLKVGL